MSTVGTHVLDAALGRPAAGVDVVLTAPDGSTHPVTTDADGRARIAADVPAGACVLRFATGPWFAAQGRETFHPAVTVEFTATAGEHHHVALLLSPFAYTTYRGS